MESHSQDEQVLFTTPIADPLASEKLTTKLLQLTTKCKYKIRMKILLFKLLIL